MTATEGRVPFGYEGETFHAYYKIIGSLSNRTRTLVVVVHGGPGLAQDYLIPHTNLADNHSFPIVFYDQVGNARSTHLSKAQVPLLNEYHIVGHSWGGMLEELVVRRRAMGLKRLVIADSPADIALWGWSFKKLLEPFPKSVKEVIGKGEAADQKAWWDAMMVFYAQHGYRNQPFPQEFLTTFAYSYGQNCDQTVGNSGVTTGWSIVDQVHDIDVPTLAINGRYEVAQDYVTEAYIKKVAGAEWIKFGESSHLPFWRERAKYMEAVAEFLGQ